MLVLFIVGEIASSVYRYFIVNALLETNVGRHHDVIVLNDIKDIDRKC